MQAWGGKYCTLYSICVLDMCLSDTEPLKGNILFEMSKKKLLDEILYLADSIFIQPSVLLVFYYSPIAQ